MSCHFVQSFVSLAPDALTGKVKYWEPSYR